jgi:hypothetical protein
VGWRFAATGDEDLIVKPADGLASGVTRFVAGMRAGRHDEPR